jgi:hypothetical protein
MDKWNNKTVTKNNIDPVKKQSKNAQTGFPASEPVHRRAAESQRVRHKWRLRSGKQNRVGTDGGGENNS